ncbi:hypothetical protein COOONC_11573 [Cooperia oncophora]
MSSRRRVQKISYSEELDDDDDYYGRSYEDDVAMSPSVTGYMYQRQKPSCGFTIDTKLSELIPEELNHPESANDAPDYQEDQMFDMDIDGGADGKAEKPTAASTSTTQPKIDLGPPPGLGFDEAQRGSKPIVISLPPMAPSLEKEVGIDALTIAQTFIVFDLYDTMVKHTSKGSCISELYLLVSPF